MVCNALRSVHSQGPVLSGKPQPVGGYLTHNSFLPSFILAWWWQPYPLIMVSPFLLLHLPFPCPWWGHVALQPSQIFCYVVSSLPPLFLSLVLSWLFSVTLLSPHPAKAYKLALLFILPQMGFVSFFQHDVPSSNYGVLFTHLDMACPQKCYRVLRSFFTWRFHPNLWSLCPLVWAWLSNLKRFSSGSFGCVIFLNPNCSNRRGVVWLWFFFDHLVGNSSNINAQHFFLLFP